MSNYEQTSMNVQVSLVPVVERVLITSMDSRATVPLALLDCYARLVSVAYDVKNNSS